MGGCLSSSTPADQPSRSESTHRRSVNVISANGDLHQYTSPLTVSQLLEEMMEVQTLTQQHDHPSSSNIINSNSFFVCNSDRLYYDDFIPALDAQHQLHPNQIYFVLPASKLLYRLTASDMAALAVKASLAFQKSTTNTSTKHSSSSSSSSFFIRNRRNNKPARISPILADHHVNSTTSSDSSFVDRDYMDENRNGQTATTTIKNKGISIISEKQQPAAAALGVSKSGSLRKLNRYSSRRAKMAVRSFRIRLTTIYEEASVLQFY
ncbi:hypothetical protein RHGRI_015714 [Rhododendron griersonianum]|uniref:Uncharacterized protein n=1 Tax=Rhododendron griersonianum TaxID=479676 RepID=A0AAV6JR96_9ERIC|nr:hypothetical protein RHGRI_015714 [Rhododendron griersonianum]